MTFCCIRVFGPHADLLRAWVTLPPRPYLLLKHSPKHQFKAADRGRASEFIRPVPFFYIVSVNCLFCLLSTLQANQKCSDLHGPWSGSALFGLKLSCNQSYFKVPAAACPVLPISQWEHRVIALLPCSSHAPHLPPSSQ